MKDSCILIQIPLKFVPNGSVVQLVVYSIILTHDGLMLPYDFVDLGNHWLAQQDNILWKFI